MVETIFHLGAHRCATTTFQAYLDENTAALSAAGVAVWTPQAMRGGQFDGLVRPPEAEGLEAQRKQAIATARIAAARGGLQARQLIVSEENMIGTPRDNLARQALYPDLSRRLARFHAAFAGEVQTIGLAIRSYEHYWASVLAFAVAQGAPVPDVAARQALVDQPRGWGGLIREVRSLFPTAKLKVWTFEAFAGRPRRQLNMLIGRADVAHLLDQTPQWKNNSRNCNRLRHRLRAQGRVADAVALPKGRDPWMPFDADQRATMAAAYADDLAWLRSGADPAITFTEKAAIKVLRKTERRNQSPHETGGQNGPDKIMV